MNFPSRLRALRLKHKMTQEQLGKKINVTKVSISGYENGTRTPDLETLQKIADVFDVTVDYLLGRTDQTINIHEEFRRIQESIPEWGENAGQIALDETKKVLIKLIERGELTPVKAKPIIAFLDAMIEEFENNQKSSEKQ
ncbi:helix-turn-helix domain-containing protein [Planifilum fimeticola]|uniref:helix-turn-helix domain-containing protein n=1 Tax=Planifilum fimeticola TaxID=201975 RepID=UPI002481E572|nr:helix-turn-helix transcriptional regulator [Planifilum fimeticola]